MSPRARMGGVWFAGGAAPAEVVAGVRSALGSGAQVLVVDAPEGRWRGVGEVADADPAPPGAPGQPGAYAVARADGTGRLELSRDAVGHRSLYWAEPRPELVVFASTLQGVLGSGLIPREVELDAVAAFLTYAYVPGERTLLRGVNALPAGCTLVLTPGREPVVRRDWALPEAEAGPALGEDTLREALRSELNAVMQAHLPPAGAPFGATLSGGIDSSLVLALASRLHAGPARAYSITFGAPHRDELQWSALLARHVGVPQEVVHVREADVVARFDEAVQALSEPNGDPLTVPNLLLFEAAAAHSPVLFNGEGGDPTFGGPKNAPMLLASLLDDADELGPAYLRAHQRCFDDLGDLLHPDAHPAQRTATLVRDIEPALRARPGLLDAWMAVNVDFKGAWHILPKVDHLGARFGVSPRSPLFDQRLVEFAFRIPGPLKRRGAVEKHLLKEAVRDLVPAAIIERPKSGMMVPVEAWFSGPLRRFAEERLLERTTLHRLVRREAIEALLAGKQLGLRPRRGIKLWLLCTLESWLRGVGAG